MTVQFCLQEIEQFKLTAVTANGIDLRKGPFEVCNANAHDEKCFPMRLRLYFINWSFALCYTSVVSSAGATVSLPDFNCYHSELRSFDPLQVDAALVDRFSNAVETCEIARLSAALRVAIWNLRELALACHIPTFRRIMHCPAEIGGHFAVIPHVTSAVDEAFIAAVTTPPGTGHGGVYSGFRVHLFLRGAAEWMIFTLLDRLRSELIDLSTHLEFAYSGGVIDLGILVVGSSMREHHALVKGLCDGFIAGYRWQQLRSATIEAAQFVAKIHTENWADSIEFSHRSAVLDLVYRDAFATAARLADAIFVEFGDGPGHEACYKECLLGTVAMNLLRSVPFAVLDKEAWLERFLVAAMAMQTQTSMVASMADDEFWPTFVFWHLLLRLRSPKEYPHAPSPNPAFLSYLAAPFPRDMEALTKPAVLFEQAYLSVHGSEGRRILTDAERLDIMDAVQTVASMTEGMPEDSLLYVTVGHGRHLDKVGLRGSRVYYFL
ncbi:hypothetical protein FOZ63_025123 [Perkinsus olseni]|uniref:Uncharacterized protein n=1 Tax=Perkinsus olseni TaxID=32597 RepID=A0A7J6RAP7_PEROL|nr:hypothetical protein FOZ63_025123 [Perkinsus olseni]